MLCTSHAALPQCTLCRPCIGSTEPFDSQLGAIFDNVRGDSPRRATCSGFRFAGACPVDALQVANLARNFTNGAPIPDLKDGGWHMLSLTSQPDGSLGFRMYVDGALAGQMAGNQTYVGVLLSFLCATTMRPEASQTAALRDANSRSELLRTPAAD